ncbi:MAG: ABC transporter substrate-binding protein [Anaerolineae bacterium]|nr:ABC transporter substrate-binding protein [Anaerolineae bacterium]
MMHLANLRHRAIHAWAWVRHHPHLMLFALILVLGTSAGWMITRPGALLGPKDVTWHRVQTNKDLYVGLDPNYPPFAEWTPEQIEGLEADIAREIGRRLGVETSILIMGYDGLYDALLTGEVDFLIAGLTVDPGQEEWVHYTRAYFDAGQVLVSRSEDAYQHIRDLDGKIIAVEIASAGHIAAQRWQRRLSALDVVPVMLPDDAMQAVQDGSVDAALVDTVSARLYLNAHPDLVMADDTTVPERFRIALRQENFRLAEAVEDALDAMHADGTLDALIAKWF